jgi:hypothetical protein
MEGRAGQQLSQLIAAALSYRLMAVVAAEERFLLLVAGEAALDCRAPVKLLRVRLAGLAVQTMA